MSRVALALASIAFLLACAVSCATGPGRDGVDLPEIVLTGDDQRIDRSAKVRPGTYRIEDVAGDGAITIVADDVTLDLSGVTLIGSPEGAEADHFTGIGIRAEGVSGLVIRRGAIRGYRVAVEVVDAEDPAIVEVDLSGNFRQRLASTPDAEVSSDWLWPHENDDDQWARNYGAGLHMKSVTGGRVEFVRVRRGQNGIILNRCEGVRVAQNDASYLSGWGLAMWRSIGCEVTDNRFDFCVRGYSHGVYARGQDSAGILVFEQCSRNSFRQNSATHGGDGFFLYAGNETLRETGEGGSNDNLVLANDFSHAVANAIEATFSSGNRFEGNILDDSNYGVWAGYSYGNWIVGNVIERNSIAGVAIEHGVDNTILGNWFFENPVAVSLWWDEDPDLTDSAFGRRRSTESIGNRILGNRYAGDLVALSLRDVESTGVGDDGTDGAARALEQQGRGSVFRIGPEVAEELAELRPERRPAREQTFLPDGALRGRDRIFVDEWGPYDGEGLRAWPRRLEGTAAGRVHLLGPGVPFRIDSISGDVVVTPRAGRLPATVEVRPRDGSTGVLPFQFVALTDEGEVRVGGSLLTLPWTVRYHRWAPAGAGEPPTDWESVRASAALFEERRSDLDLHWGSGAPAEGVPPDHFATIATSAFRVPAGRYELRVTSDDGVRVSLDGEVVHEDWSWHAAREAAVPIDLDASEHRLEIEHFEIDGHARLRAVLVPAEVAR